MPKKIEISHRTIVFTVLFLISLWFLYQIRQILVIFFVGLLITAALNPLVERLEKIKIPRVLAIVFIYLVIFAFLVLMLAGIIPPLANQTATLVTRLPEYLKSLGLAGVEENLVRFQVEQLLDRLGSISLSLVRTTISIFGNLIVVFTLVFISFYLLLERENLDEYLSKLFGDGKDRKIARLVKLIEKRLGNWFRAQISLMVIVGVMTYIGLRLLGIDFALPLALLAGFLEIVPNIGPIISAVPAILAGLALSPLMGLSVAGLYFVIQQLENNLIVPQIMAKEVGVNPLVTLLALITGFKVGGVAGAVLAIPVVTLIETLVKEFFTSEGLV